MVKWPVVSLVTFALIGCSSMPTTGPTASQIEAARRSESTPGGLDLVAVTPAVADRLEHYRTLPLSGRFADRRPTQTMTVGIGDTLSVSVFEAGAGGLFSTSTGQIGGGTKSATLPLQPVGPDGHITVPYAGRVAVLGKSTDQIEKVIVERLRDKAIEPQAVVTVHSARSNLVTVDGEVGAAGRVPLSPKGDRLIDVIAGAGGTKGRANDLFVRLTRDGHTASVPFRTLLEDPTQNIWARSGDQIFVYREPQTFTAYGATGRSGTFPFEYDQLSLAEAIGQAAGLNDLRAEPAGIFVYRRERAEVVCDIENEHPCASPERPRPVVYQFNMRDPNGIALTQRVLVRNKDLIYVANADSVEATKVIRLFSDVAGVASDVGSTSNSVTATESRIRNW